MSHTNNKNHNTHNHNHHEESAHDPLHIEPHNHRAIIGFDENGIPKVLVPVSGHTHKHVDADGNEYEHSHEEVFTEDYMKAVAAYRKTFPSKQDVLDNVPDPAVKEMMLHMEQIGQDTAFDRFDKLLLKYYEPEEGEITIDGVDIGEYRNDALRRVISYVPQNIELFSKSIYDNIRVSRQNATLEEVKEAAKAADAHDFIKRLPMQYYTFLEEAGNGLSGGEKQRIALARAFLKTNEFYILDESTSNLDFATENVIFDMIYNKFRNKSMLIIAHRLATVKNCDRIIVLEKGEIVEQGTHEELLKMQGKYYELWEMQQGNFVTKEEKGLDEPVESVVEDEDNDGVMSYT